MVVIGFSASKVALSFQLNLSNRGICWAINLTLSDRIKLTVLFSTVSLFILCFRS